MQIDKETNNETETSARVEATARVILKHYFAGKLRTKPVNDKDRDYLRVCAFTSLIIMAYYTETQERFNEGSSYLLNALPLVGDTVARLMGLQGDNATRILDIATTIN